MVLPQQKKKQKQSLNDRYLGSHSNINKRGLISLLKNRCEKLVAISFHRVAHRNTGNEFFCIYHTSLQSSVGYRTWQSFNTLFYLAVKF